MWVDALNLFDPTNTPVTVSADSTNQFDVVGTGLPASPQGRDLGPGAKLSVRVCLQQTFLAAGAATLQVVLKAAPDNGGVPGAFAILAQTDAIPKANLVAGAFIELPIPPQPPQSEAAPPAESGPPRFYKLGYVVANGPFTAGQVESFIVDEASSNNITYPRNFAAI